MPGDNVSASDYLSVNFNTETVLDSLPEHCDKITVKRWVHSNHLSMSLTRVKVRRKVIDILIKTIDFNEYRFRVHSHEAEGLLPNPRTNKQNRVDL